MKRRCVRFFTSISLLLTTFMAFGQQSTDSSRKRNWSELINLRGYIQTRYNRLLETNPQLKCEQCDRSLGEGGGFFIRRARLIFSGQLNNNIYFYLQPDFASSVGGGLNYVQIRDAYVDISVGQKREFRVRLGQSKVPFGFENMQSSQNRIPLDRNDALNSAVANERDIGAFFYYAPDHVRELYADLVQDGLKGSGDYGVFGIGLFNGQTANRPEANNNMHKVARLSYPFRIGSQIIEPGIQAYSGIYTFTSDLISSGTKITPDRSYIDERAAASFVLYPKPFGIQAEYNVGRGPEFNMVTDSIEVRRLNGGYSTFSYITNVGDHVLIPFVRMQYYRGGKKHERDARAYQVQDYEIGIEWQPMKYFELTALYMISRRWTSDQLVQDNFQKGQTLRLQAQLNF